jgi:hypothetical protein
MASSDPTGLPPGLTPELLEKMRAIGLRLDKAGTLWHQGTAVSHPRLRQALLRWLDVLPDGRDIVRLDERRYAYVEVEDAHLRALSARWEGDRCTVVWDDEQEEELDYGSLCQAADHAFYARARGGSLRGRIAGPAYHAVTERVIETEAGTFALAAAGAQWPIAGGA